MENNITIPLSLSLNVFINQEELPRLASKEAIIQLLLGLLAQSSLSQRGSINLHLSPRVQLNTPPTECSVTP